ncbi:GntR family transcriptional regulator [Ammoniphilus sp. YIM 78166]|uniref:GntR family transcriptional regulator n=1 Tax=Ammoniphilus sp. YIM 78166 TaxID=1644106 RepID=UPI00106FC241|nr:GntR family transcriptional regulator [Ammoniphilus sp. YIM 78166]
MIINPDPRPLYMKVVDKLKEEIQLERFQPGQQLPPEPKLAKSLGVSRATLREALRVLEEENVVERMHGVGTFIKINPVIAGGIEELLSITEMIERNGQKPGAVMLSIELVEVEEKDQARLQLQPREKVLLLKRIRTANNENVIFCIDKIPAKFLPEDFSYKHQSLFEDLKESTNLEIQYARSDISAIGYDAQISNLLHCEPGESLLVLNQLHYDRLDRPIIYSNNYFRANKFKFSVVRRRKN